MIAGSAYDEATARGEVTPEVKAALADPAVAAGRIYELVVIGVITS